MTEKKGWEKFKEGSLLCYRNKVSSKKDTSPDLKTPECRDKHTPPPLAIAVIIIVARATSSQDVIKTKRAATPLGGW